MYPPEYQHLLDFLDSNPEYLQDMRTRLLMPDLIALPEQFAQLVGLVLQSRLWSRGLKASPVMTLHGTGLVAPSPA